MRKNVHRHIMYGLVGLISGFLGLLFYFLFIPNPYLTPFLMGWVNKQGWGTFEVENIALRPYEVHLKNVKYFPAPEIPSLSLTSANLKISWDKFSPKIQEVILRDLIISKETIEKMMGTSSSTSFAIPSLTFKNALFSSENNSFPIRLSFDGKLIPGISFEGRFHLIVSDNTFQGAVESLLSTPQIKARLYDLSLNLKGWEHLPISGQGELIAENDNIRAYVSGSCPDLKLESQCAYTFEDKTSHCILSYESNDLGNVVPKSWLQPYSLQNFSGLLKGSATITIKDSVMEPMKGSASFSSLSFDHPLIKIRNLSTSINYIFDKVLSFPKQPLKILISNADMGLPLSDLQLQLTWDGVSHYNLHEGIAFLEGGQLSTKDVSFSLPSKP